MTRLAKGSCVKMTKDNSRLNNDVLFQGQTNFVNNHIYNLAIELADYVINTQRPEGDPPGYVMEGRWISWRTLDCKSCYRERRLSDIPRILAITLSFSSGKTSQLRLRSSVLLF